MKLQSILLLDDNNATNFIHTKFLGLSDLADKVHSFQVGEKALNFLRETPIFPDILFIDINMPTMDCWEFLNEYRTIDRPEKQSAKIYVLTTTISPNDEDRVAQFPEINKMILKPLNLDSIGQIKNELNLV